MTSSTPKNIVAYKCLLAVNALELESKTKALIDAQEGWEPFGGVAGVAVSETRLAQSWVRYATDGTPDSETGLRYFLSGAALFDTVGGTQNVELMHDPDQSLITINYQDSNGWHNVEESVDDLTAGRTLGIACDHSDGADPDSINIVLEAITPSAATILILRGSLNPFPDDRSDFFTIEIPASSIPFRFSCDDFS